MVFTCGEAISNEHRRSLPHLLPSPAIDRFWQSSSVPAIQWLKAACAETPSVSPWLSENKRFVVDICKQVSAANREISAESRCNGWWKIPFWLKGNALMTHIFLYLLFVGYEKLDILISAVCLISLHCFHCNIYRYGPNDGIQNCWVWRLGYLSK